MHDVVLLTVKAHQVGPIAEDLKHLIGPETAVVTMQNGIPWWYFLGDRTTGRMPARMSKAPIPAG